MLPYGEVEEKRKVQGDVDMGFSPPTKSRWKLRVEKENWGPGICLSLKNKNKTSHLFTCNAHFIVQDRKAEGSGESWSRSYHESGTELGHKPRGPAPDNLPTTSSTLTTVGKYLYFPVF